MWALTLLWPLLMHHVNTQDFGPCGLPQPTYSLNAQTEHISKSTQNKNKSKPTSWSKSRHVSFHHKLSVMWVSVWLCSDTTLCILIGSAFNKPTNYSNAQLAHHCPKFRYSQKIWKSGLNQSENSQSVTLHANISGCYGTKTNTINFFPILTLTNFGHRIKTVSHRFLSLGLNKTVEMYSHWLSISALLVSCSGNT